MNKLTISTEVNVYNYEELPPKYKELVDAAKAQTANAYAPYSQFHVGAAARLQNGQIFTGNNQENVAYPSGLCAERVVLFAAHAQCPNIPVMTLAIAAYNAKDSQFHLATPCGACRQVIAEFQKQSGFPITLLLYSPEKVVIIKDAGELLPLAFDFPQ